MALSRKLLKGMGLTEEQVDTIIEAHTETVDGLKADVKKYQADAENLPKIRQELEALKAKGNDGWKDKYDKVKKEFDDYKSDITAKESKAAKEKAVRAYYESKNITGKALDIAMRGSGAEISAVELDDKGGIKDASALDSLVKGDFSGLVSVKSIEGANTANPPVNTGGKTVDKEDIMKIKDAGERQKAIAENHEIFGF
ncbi:MAG: hypothetical protein NC320_09060 [Clostridium sp.]|nr:hypothetical protein [Clostridium sp.]MCM1547924.1 hypothetical protein [Ruminococcus sp.]